MAKDRRRSSQSSQRLNNKAKNNYVDEGKPHLQPEQMLRANARTQTLEASQEYLRNLHLHINSENLYTVIDSSNRLFVQKKDSSELIECCGLPAGFAASYRQQIISSMEKRAAEENTVQASVGDRLKIEINRENDKLISEGQSNESSRKKRQFVPINNSPTKRRRSTFLTPPEPMRASNAVGKHVEDEEETKEQEGDDEGEEEDEEIECDTFEKRDVRVCDLGPVMEDIMRNLQQKGLKRILKLWLGKSHPKKQAEFPYNGGREQEKKRKSKDPDYEESNPGRLTAPDYWYSQEDCSADKNHNGTGVRHKEPDHLLKHERITLCKHLLHAGYRYKDAKFDLDAMEESTSTVEKDHAQDFRLDARRLIDSLYYARRKEIEYEKGEIDADTTVYVEMKVPNRSRRRRRVYKSRRAKKPKQFTPELAGFFEDDAPIKPSPSANSSFTSVFDKTIAIESGRTTPLPDPLLRAVSPYPHASVQMQRKSSQNSFGDSRVRTISSSSQDGSHLSAKSTPSPSEGDTDFDQFDDASEPDRHLDHPTNQSMTTHQGSQYRHDKQEQNTPNVTIPITAPSFPRYFVDQQNGGALHHPYSSEQQATTVASPTHIDPAAVTYLQSRLVNSNNSERSNNPGNTSSTSVAPSPHPVYSDNRIQVTPHPSLTSAPQLYRPYPPHPGPNNHVLMPPQTPSYSAGFTMPIHPTNASVPAVSAPQAPSLTHGYPSSASSDFNGAMPVDPEWHNVDHSYGFFHDGTYQQQHQQHTPDISAAGAPSAMAIVSGHHYDGLPPQQQLQEQNGVNNTGIVAPIRFFPTEWGAMENDPARYSTMGQQHQQSQMQVHGLGPPAVLGPGSGIGGPGGMPRRENGYGYGPSLGV